MNGIILMSIIATAIALGGTGGYRLAGGYRLGIGELAAAAAASLGVGIIIGGLIAGALYGGPECKDGEIMVRPDHNRAGASGCIPLDRLKDIAK